MKKANQIHSHFTLYRRTAAGELMRVGEVSYAFTGERVPSFDETLRDYLHYDTSAAREQAEADLAHRHTEADAFEALIDAANKATED